MAPNHVSCPVAIRLPRRRPPFFLQAAQEAGFEISKRIPIIIRQRPNPGNKRKAAAAGSEEGEQKRKPAKTPNGSDDPVITDQPVAWEDRLVAKFPEFNPAWDATVQAKWFESFEKLMALRK